MLMMAISFCFKNCPNVSSGRLAVYCRQPADANPDNGGDQEWFINSLIGFSNWAAMQLFQVDLRQMLS